MADCRNNTAALHGGAVYEAARRWGVSPSAVLDFSANINPMGPPESVIQALARATASACAAYPDSTELVAALAARHGVERETIVIGNGSAALIFAAARALAYAFPELRA